MKTLYKIVVSAAFVLLSAPFAFAQTERESGAALYRSGDYAGAVKLLKRAAKGDDAQAFYFLGLSYLKLNKVKESEKALKRALALDGGNAKIRVGLAYVYLLKNDTVGAQKEARSVLEANPNDEEAHYIIGAVNLRGGSYNYAYERAKKAIEINPNFASAYLLKSKALVSSFSIQAGTVLKTQGARSELLREASEDLEKYLSLSPKGEDAAFERENLESIKFFYEYYSRPENQKPLSFDSAPEKPQENRTPLKIISKPRAEFTQKARAANVSGGVVRCAVGFSADGQVKHVLIIKPLGYGLDEESVKAARAIKFEPELRDGKPISVVRIIEYTFTLY